jgi:hypothetical protein
MADLSPRNLSRIKAQDPVVGECLSDIVASHNNIAQQVNAAPVGTIAAPDSHTALKVTGGAGYFHAQITDGAPGFRGKEHFLEVSETKDFAAPHVIHLGASQTWYGNLGAKNLHFRSYAAYATSAPSKPIYAMNISGAGDAAPSIMGNGSAAGYGTNPFTTPTMPKR